MKPYSYSGWAIEHRSRGPLAETPRLLGPLMWWPWRRMPIQTAGHRIALFNTRAQARQALPPRWSANGNDHWYVPVRVRVTIAAEIRAKNGGIGKP